MCSLAPRLTNAATDSRIHIHSLSDVTSVTGPPGEFNVTVRHHPRYVDEKCVGCGECAAVCPVTYPSEFDFGVAERTAISRPFANAVPSTFAVDRKAGARARRPARCTPRRKATWHSWRRAGTKRPTGSPASRTRSRASAAASARTSARRNARAATWTSPSRSPASSASWPTTARRRSLPRRCPCSTTSRWRSWAAAPQASPPPASSRSAATRRPCSKLCRSPAACCASAFPITACRATSWTERGRARHGARRGSCARRALRRGLHGRLAVRRRLQGRLPGRRPPSEQDPADRRPRPGGASCAPSSSCARRHSARRPGPAGAWSSSAAATWRTMPAARHSAAAPRRSRSPASKTSARRRPRLMRSRKARRSRSASSTPSCPSRSSAPAAVATGVRLQRCTLGEPNERGWRRPVPVDGEFVEFEADTVIFAIGQALVDDFLTGAEGVAVERGQVETDPWTR